MAREAHHTARMVLKSHRARTRVLAALFLLSGCVIHLPWSKQPGETNVTFHTEKNVLVMDSVTIEHRPGKFIFATSLPHTALNASFAAALGPAQPRGYTVQFGRKATTFTAPATVDLHGLADAVLGADSWVAPVVTIDYRTGLISFDKSMLLRDDMVVSRYEGPPSVTVQMDGQQIQAVVDTASPDTLTLPLSYGPAGRGRASVTMGGIQFASVDVRFADVPDAHVGNRLLSKFLVLIDQSRHLVGLWRDPRTPAGV
jgi:hypothetical protein